MENILYGKAVKQMGKRFRTRMGSLFVVVILALTACGKTPDQTGAQASKQPSASALNEESQQKEENQPEDEKEVASSKNSGYQDDGQISYLQGVDQIYNMETGILHANLVFEAGKDIDFVYDFNEEAYKQLIDNYNIELVAKGETEFDRARRLMDAYAGRLKHESNFKDEVPISAIPLLEYALDNDTHGINCRGKAQILNEMCLALNIYARKVWIMPYSIYDTECHVVNEVYDTTLNKWVMLDITHDEYWVDEKGTPLSVLEIRQLLADQKFCTPLRAGEDRENLQDKLTSHYGDFLYIAKNMAYFNYCKEYGQGEDKAYCSLVPKGMEAKEIISREAVEQAPLKK